MNNLENKVIILTGASKGIGKVTSKKLTAYNPKLVLLSRKMSDLEKLKAELNYTNAIFIEADVSKEDDCKKIVTRTVEKFGTVDVLINNAAQFARGNVVDLKLEDFDRVLATNIRGVFILTKLVLPFMIKQNRGSIVNISSTAGKRGSPGGSAYTISKFALNGFTECLFKEVREYNIRVLTISPSMVDTKDKPVEQQKETGKGVYMRAEDVADSIINSLMLPQRAMVKDIELWGTNP
jgi:3-oxoacyl-[acyl-carrier protein] reductase